jgi:hypothetical protein
VDNKFLAQNIRKFLDKKLAMETPGPKNVSRNPQKRLKILKTKQGNSCENSFSFPRISIMVIQITWIQLLYNISANSSRRDENLIFFVYFRLNLQGWKNFQDSQKDLKNQISISMSKRHRCKVSKNPRISQCHSKRLCYS